MRGFADWYGCLSVASVRDGGSDEGSTRFPKKADDDDDHTPWPTLVTGPKGVLGGLGVLRIGMVASYGPVS